MGKWCVRGRFYATITTFNVYRSYSNENRENFVLLCFQIPKSNFINIHFTVEVVQEIGFILKFTRLYDPIRRNDLICHFIV